MDRLISLTIAAVAGFATPLLARELARPNIVLVMTDDQGWGQTGYRDHPVLKTPNLDAMAAGGLRFDRFYAGAPVCSPTRASIITGKYPQRVKITDYISPPGSNQPEQWQRNTELLPAPYESQLALEPNWRVQINHEIGVRVHRKYVIKLFVQRVEVVLTEPAQNRRVFAVRLPQ